MNDELRALRSMRHSVKGHLEDVIYALERGEVEMALISAKAGLVQAKRGPGASSTEALLRQHLRDSVKHLEAAASIVGGRK